MAVFADPRDLRTVKAAAKCLKASVSGPPPATSNSCLSNNMEAYVLPEPLVPEEQQFACNSAGAREIFLSEGKKLVEDESCRLFTGKNDGLRVSSFRLLSHGLLNDFVQLGRQRYGPGAR